MQKSLTKLYFILATIGITTSTQAQNQDIDASPEWNGIITGDFYPMREYVPAVIGTEYLLDTWSGGTIYFRSGLKQENMKVNYNLKNDVLEIYTDEEIKVCDTNLLKGFKLNDGRVFVNNRSLDKGLGFGVSELLFKNKVTLVNRRSVEIQEPNYVKTHDVGEKDKKIVHKNHYYLIEEGQARTIHKKIKKNQELFGEQYAVMSEFIASNKLKLNDEAALVKVIKKYDSLK